MDCPIGGSCHIWLMGGNHKGGTGGLAQVPNHLQNVVAILLVQIAGRLIHNHNGRIGGQSPSYRHPLLLATAELVRLIAQTMAQPDQIQQLRARSEGRPGCLPT